MQHQHSEYFPSATTNNNMRPWSPPSAEAAAAAAADSVLLRHVPGRGRAVIAARRFDAGCEIVSELPCCGFQSLGSRENKQGDVLACAHAGCLAALPAVGTQLGMRAASVTRAALVASCADDGVMVLRAEDAATVAIGRIGKPLADRRTGAGGSGLPVERPLTAAAAPSPDEAPGAEGAAVGGVEQQEEEVGAAPIFGCPGLCGAFFCTAACRAAALATGHEMLCPGMLAQRMAWQGGASSAAELDARLAAHPLMQFKEHAIATNEVFLLAAQVRACVRARARARV